MFFIKIACQTLIYPAPQRYQSTKGLIWLEILETTYSGKCSKVLNTLLFLFSNNMLIIRARIAKMCFHFNKMFVRILNREDSDQTASSEAV